MYKKSLMAVLLLFIAKCAFAGFMSGSELVSNMREYEKAQRSDRTTVWIDDGMYLGYVYGVSDTIWPHLCPPGNIKGQQVVAIVAQYLKVHPEEWNKPASDLVTKALKKAFPCK